MNADNDRRVERFKGDSFVCANLPGLNDVKDDIEHTMMTKSANVSTYRRLDKIETIDLGALRESLEISNGFSSLPETASLETDFFIEPGQASPSLFYLLFVLDGRSDSPHQRRDAEH
jgi:hypothetical protein